MREIARFNTASEAKIALGFLRSRGFDVLLPDEHTLDAESGIAIAFGGYRLLASDEDAAGASMALRSADPEASPPPCPSCGSRQVTKERAWRAPRGIRAALSFLFPLAPATGRTQCSRCGISFDEDQTDEPEHAV